MFWAGLLALSLANPRARLAALGLGVLLLTGWLGVDHRAQAEQVRLNQRERARAIRIVASLERLPGWPRVRRAVLIGHQSQYLDLPATYDFNASALGVTWSQAALLAEVSGTRLEPGSGADRALAEARCAGLPKWPAEGSAQLEGELAMVCF